MTEIRHEADLEKVAQAVTITKEAFEIGDMGEDFLRETLTARLTGYVVAGAPKKVRVELEYPASWWQYTKGRILENPLTPLGEWLRVLFPPRMGTVSNTETINRRICPHDPVSDPEHSHMEWVAGPEIYTNKIEELEQLVDHWRTRAQVIERRSNADRETLSKQAAIIKRGFRQ